MSDQKDQPHTSDLASDLPAAAAALSAEDRADLVNAIKNKLQELSMGHSNFMDSLSPKVRKRVDFLREIQSQHDELEAKFFEERAVLEAKFQKLYEPLYTKRYEIVNGVIHVEGVSDESSMDQKLEQTIEEKGIPHFWLTAMKNNETLCKEITEHDEGALHYLKDIKWSRLDGEKGFKLEFFFDPNPYFSNNVLTKTYRMISEEEHILEKAIGTEIQWLPGKNLTQKILKKKPKKGSKDTKPITKVENCESFFLFFDPPQLPEDEEELEEETAELLQCQMEQDYEIGSTIREKIIPHAVSWFTGEAVSDDEDDDDNEDDEEDDDDDSEEEEDTEDDMNKNEERERKTDK
ncbi:nucleosome assembly protein 1;1-like [Ipomoea triloba]|uniref:nucleosome assembly protein 1;1-like n=1 Tax=Ipomoea triloba TaxID=35885 RepID=UPI00125D7400|nr:nucleosome assembly protein 1;1-like [Ipomoea triloba]